MVQYIALRTKAPKPPIGEIEMNLLAQPEWIAKAYLWLHAVRLVTACYGNYGPSFWFNTDSSKSHQEY